MPRWQRNDGRRLVQRLVTRARLPIRRALPRLTAPLHYVAAGGRHRDRASAYMCLEHPEPEPRRQILPDGAGVLAVDTSVPRRVSERLEQSFLDGRIAKRVTPLRATGQVREHGDPQGGNCTAEQRAYLRRRWLGPPEVP